MKSLTMRLTVAAAAFVAVAGVASAQTMEAKIPFAFRANGKVLAAGTYRVTTNYGNSADLKVHIRNTKTSDQVLSLGFANADPKKSWVAAGNAVLEFQCGTGPCTLDKLWMGQEGTPAYKLPTPKPAKDEYRITAEIVMHRAASE